MRESTPTPLPILIRAEEVLHFLGYPEGHRPPARILDRLDSLLVEAREHLDGKGAFVRLPVESAGDVGLEAMDASGLVIGLVTVGAGIEDRASECMAAGDSLSALILDAMGSAAAEEAADRLGAIVAGGSSGAVPVAALSCRVSPGYGGWSLASQRQLFERLPCEELGIELLPSLLMVPRKSISFAMWLGVDARPLAGLSGCSRCPLGQCSYRRESRTEGNVS